MEGKGRSDQLTGQTVGAEETPASPSGAGSAGADGRFRIGIAGYDLWPHTVSFCRTLQGADFCRISDVWDEDPRKLERLVELTGATGHRDLAAFCRSGVQGAIVTVRTNRRCEVATALARAGKHVLSDKPMAMTAAECLEIIRACRRAGVTLMGGYNFRYWQVWPLMKRIMDSGELGAPVHFYCAYNTGMVKRSEWEPTLDSYWTDPETTPGGGWFTHGDHAVDLVRWLFDCEFTEVLADMRKLRYPQFAVEDYGVAHFLLDNGATALIHSDAIAPAARIDVEVICQKGGISYKLVPEPRLKVWGAPSLGAAAVDYAIRDNWVDALREMTRAFVHACETGTPPPISGEDNLRVIEVAEAAYRSSREGRRVKIEQAPVE
jgi:predicted dehydrogenase